MANFERLEMDAHRVQLNGDAVAGRIRHRRVDKKEKEKWNESNSRN